MSPSAAIVVENESVPGDRRVWNQARTLRRHGWDVSVVCPRAAGEPRRERLDGVDLVRFGLREARRAVGYPVEYAQAVAAIGRALGREWRRRPFDVVQLCNPPDLLFPVARAARRRGAAIVFDHHDLAPELWLSRGGRAGGVVHRALLAAERRTFAAADVVMSTNDSYRAVACERGGIGEEDCFVVRNGPVLEELAAALPATPNGRGGTRLVGYVGSMGAQDGVDGLLAALRHIVVDEDRREVGAVLVGDGPELPRLRHLAGRWGLDPHVRFTGRVPHDEVAAHLAPVDVCVCPDPPSPLNDRSTMIKVVEYLALAKPVVGYPLPETVVTAGDCAVYAHPADHRELGRSILQLLDDPARAARLGRRGRERVVDRFTWSHSEPQLLAAYDRARRHARQRAERGSGR